VKTVIKIFILLLAALTAVRAFYYLTGKRHTGAMEIEDQENVQEDSRNDNETRATGVAKIAGGYAIKLPQDIQQQAAIRLARLEPVQYRSEIHATGQVIDIQPLLDMRSRYHEIQGQQRITDASLEVTRQEYERLQQLHKEAANISTRELQQAQLQWESRAAESRVATVSLDDLRHQFIQSWGEELTGLFLADSDLFRALSMRKSVLLLVTVTGARQIDPGTRTAFASTGDNRESAEEVGYISVAPATDMRTQGATYFFQAPVSTLRTGMNVDVWIPEGNEEQQGVMIPAEAVIWYLDKPWVYVARDKETFARVEMKKYAVTRQGWFVTEGFNPGDMIVTAGAQMLLSQEFRWSIPDEDENP
jgi:hypothetical protein